MRIPNLPEAFRKRGAIRSQPGNYEAAPSNGPDSNKRPYSAMALDGQITYEVESDGLRIKIRKLQPGSLPPHLANAKNLAIRSWPAASTNSTLSAAGAGPMSVDLDNDSGMMQMTPPSMHASVQKHRTRHKSKSNSPSLTPIRIPSPASSLADAAVVLPSPASDSLSVTPAAGSGASSISTAVAPPGPEESSPSLSATTPSSLSIPDTDLDHLNPIELVRVGMGILNFLVSNTFSKSFINKVPFSVTNYHTVIKKPMDLTTIEQKLWKTLDLAGPNSGTSAILTDAAGSLAMGVTEGYSSLQDFERDLRRIVQNATLFNSPTHVIYKEAQMFQNAYTNLLASYRQRKLFLNEPLPQESYRPELLSISEPGPLYLFRAHTLRELERKMTDISTDLYSCLHQPIFDISNKQIGQISPERPRFVRMYIHKNRSILAKSRDELFARIAILSDFQVGKPFAITQSPSNGPASGKTGGANGSISMVRMTAKVLIGKPIGERHDMVTVGDLDCPSAWITIACVRALEVDLDVPAKFDKGVLSKMRHEVVAYSSESKISPEHQRAFADALGLLLSASGKTGLAYGTIGQRSTIPMTTSTPISVAQSITPISTKDLGLSTSTPSASATPITSTIPTRSTSLALQKSESAAQKSDTSSTSSSNSSASRHNSTSTSISINTNVTTKSSSSNNKSAQPFKSAWVDVHDEGPSGRYLVTLQISSLLKASQRPPLTPTISSRNYVLSSQVSATAFNSELETPSAPDRVMLDKQITSRGYKMLLDLKTKAKEKSVPYQRWSDIEPTLILDPAHGLFKQIYRVRGNNDLVVQNFKEMDAESFEQRLREVACLLKLRDLEGVGQIQSVIDNQEDHLVGLSMTKYPYTLKQYATNARRHPSPCQKLHLICDMVAAMSAIHQAGLAHRDLSEVNIMVDEDPRDLLEDGSSRPHVKVIDFGKSVFVKRDEVQRWSMQDEVSEDELSLLPKMVLPPDHGYKLYRSILTLPRTKNDHSPLPPVDPRSEDVYSLGILIWRTFSGKSPWDGAIEDDLRKIRYLVSSDSQIRFHLEREIKGPYSRKLLLQCLTARAETRWTTLQLHEWLEQPEVSSELLKEFEALGGGRKKVRKNLDLKT
ncbi:hypothetical protein BGX31_002116 [Mortierella sp. GBA43]|nr:hypothetical protein BGX31_002116 [Mortierella sp. GBA43]